MRLRVSGEDRLFPDKYWKQLEGPKPPPNFECNGCSCSPDYIRHYHIYPACVIHDWHYSEKTPLTNTWAGRREADQIFKRNLITCLKSQGSSSFTAWRISWLYFGRVRIWGADHFSFSESEKPLSLWHRTLEAYGIFRDKR